MSAEGSSSLPHWTVPAAAEPCGSACAMASLREAAPSLPSISEIRLRLAVEATHDLGVALQLTDQFARRR